MVSLVLPAEPAVTLSPAIVGHGAPHVQITGLGKHYPGQQTAALEDVSLTVRRGEIFGIIGRSGAGKSTLIRCLNRLEQPSTGTVSVDGVDIGGLSEAGLVHWRRRTGMIFQHFNLLAAKTVRENIALPLRVAGVARAEVAARVDALLALVGLEALQHAWPAQLSGGQRQRVGIARALVHNPELLLCDEATSALDPETTASILALLKQINRQRGITIVLITHEMEVVHDICHQVAVLDRGRIVERGPVWQVYGDPQHDVTRRLLVPHHHQVPEAMVPLLSDQPVDSRSRPLVRLRFTGEGRAPSLTELAALGGDTTLVHSDIEWLQQRPVGQMLLLLAAEASVGGPLAALADRMEVVGYVSGY